MPRLLPERCFPLLRESYALKGNQVKGIRSGAQVDNLRYLAVTLAAGPATVHIPERR